MDPDRRHVIARAVQLGARGTLHTLLSRLRCGQLTIAEGTRRTTYGSGTPQATVVVHDPALWPRLAHGGLGLAEAYVDGLWDTPDLTALIRLAARNLRPVDELRRRLLPAFEPLRWARGALARNTPESSRRDIAAHYDLGNDMFELMLDPLMQYSCAVFPRREATLEEAQRLKLDRICDKLDLGPRDHLLEIGTGWGGLAVHAAVTRGCRVTTTTLSREQHAVAVERARAAGVEDRITFLLRDYRELEGTYGKLVSVEMIEAVGWRDFGTFFDRCSRLLDPAGAMLLQAITVDDRLFDVEKASRTFIKEHIFPHGCLPSLEVVARSVARRTDMRMVDLEDITPHYSETLRRWRANIEAAAGRLEALGYDERFRRLWRMYLCWCEAGFEERRIGDVQLVLAKPRWRGTVAAPRAAASGDVRSASSV
jgi:cyclopropane-fatty-acyl-phospholipid synthase